MGRPHLEFISSTAVEQEALLDGPFAGLSARVLSRDDANGAYTALVSADAAWSGDAAHPERPVELFVLKGAGTLGDAALAVAVYAFVPPGRRADHARTRRPGARDGRRGRRRLGGGRRGDRHA